MIKFQSQLADKIVLFLEFKHSMGIIYKTGEVTLYDFDRYNLEHGDYDYLEKETVEGWIHHKKEHSKSQYMGYMSYIRELGKYMNSQDNISYECFILGKHTARNGVAGISPPRREFQKC